MIGSWLIDQLIQQGVSDFCSAPGSRSTPLVLAALEHPKAKVHTHYDERGVGFFALGLAKGSNRPVAIIVTSGTAVGNLFPSIMEAYHSHTPIIVLTADRPHELRDCGANQTCDQVKMFQPYVAWQTDLHTEMDEHSIRSIAAQAFFHATTPAPVHINCPFKEPLHIPIPVKPGSPISLIRPKLIPPSFSTEKSKGVILVGKLPKSEDVQAVLSLAKKIKWPVLADILSNARSFPPTEEEIRYFDYIEKPAPNFVLHFGERMSSKKVLEWLKSTRPEYVHISPYPHLQDPERILTTRIQADIRPFCEQFQAKSDPNWLEKWEDDEPEFQESSYFTEVHAMRTLSEILTEEFGVFLGNGMPIRDANHFLFPKACQGFFANRGLSGIDGNIATIAGLAETMPILAFIGDQAALYDLNSLPLLKKTKHKVILIISNNFGGGIFHHLPITESPHFETYWAAAHSQNFQKAAEFFDLPYTSFDQLKLDKTIVVELKTDRNQNALYQKSWEKKKFSIV